MPIEPVYHSTREITGRLKAIDAEHPVIKYDQLEALAPNVNNIGTVSRQIQDAIQFTVEQLPEQPSLSDAKNALGSLVRNVDHGGRLHATLTHALGIARPAYEFLPLPAMPRRTGIVQPILSRREVAVVLHTHDAVEGAIKDFRNGVMSEPYHIDSNPRENALFLGDVRARQDVYDIIDRAKSGLAGLRRHAITRDEELHDETSTEITAEQTAVLDQAARGFVTELVRRTQNGLRSSMLLSEREAVIQHHVDSAIQELDIDKEPLRFATSWVTDEHYPSAHSFISHLPSFRHEDLHFLENYGPFVDQSLVQILREDAYPVESIHAELDELMHLQQQQAQASRFSRIIKHPIARVGVAALTVMLHLNPHFYPVRAFRPMIASRKWLAVSLFLQANQGRVEEATNALARAAARRMIQPHIEKPKLPERALFDALRS